MSMSSLGDNVVSDGASVLKETRKRSFWSGKLEPVKLERKDLRFVAMMKMLRCGLTCHEKTIDVQ